VQRSRDSPLGGGALRNCVLAPPPSTTPSPTTCPFSLAAQSARPSARLCDAAGATIDDEGGGSSGGGGGGGTYVVDVTCEPGLYRCVHVCACVRACAGGGGGGMWPQPGLYR